MTGGQERGRDSLTIARRLVLRLLVASGLILPVVSHTEVKTVCDGGCDHNSIKATTLDTNPGETIQVMQAEMWTIHMTPVATRFF